MAQEEKQLLLVDLCSRLPYGVKILHKGWDSDMDCDFDTVETLIGIDDRFIYTVWDKTGGREKHCLSVPNWKPYLCPMSSMTKEEIETYRIIIKSLLENSITDNVATLYNFLNSKHLDYNALIPQGLAIEAPEGMYKKG